MAHADNIYLRRIIAAVVLLATISLAAFIAQPKAAYAAQPTAGVVVSPSVKELTVSSGLIEAKHTVTVTNNTKQAVSVTPKAVDLSDLSTTGVLGFGGNQTAALSKYSLAAWMRIDGPKTFSIAAGQAVQIPVTVVNRSDLAPGGHYGAVLVQVGQDTGNADNPVAFRHELAALVLVKKLGGEQYGIQLSDVAVRGGARPSQVELTFTGKGNVHSVPRGFVTVTGGGRLLQKGEINPESTMVLPGAERSYTVHLRDVGSSALFGRNTLTVQYRADGQSDYIVHTQRLALVKWQMLAMIIGGAGVVVGGGLFLRKQPLRRKG